MKGKKLFRIFVVALLFFPIVAVLYLRDSMEGWAFMWSLSFALFFACKGVTCMGELSRLEDVDWKRVFGYLFLWVGMDARAFFSRDRRPAFPGLQEWGFAFGKVGLGVGFFLLLIIIKEKAGTLYAAWTGMLGIVLILHFGIFHLLSLAWRRLGVSAFPLMDNPLWATSLADFWGRRWNRGYNQLCRDYVYWPLCKRFGGSHRALYTILVFFLSGLVHESVISMPARGGYGGPTAYFLIQGLGLVLAESRVGRYIGLGRGARGRLFAIFVVVLPVFLLFPPIFLDEVIIPFLKVIRAL